MMVKVHGIYPLRAHVPEIVPPSRPGSVAVGLLLLDEAKSLEKDSDGLKVSSLAVIDIRLHRTDSLNHV